MFSIRMGLVLLSRSMARPTGDSRARWRRIGKRTESRRGSTLNRPCTRLYSIPFAFVGRVLGHNILAAELLNLVYYLGILTVVYRLGREIFNERAGFLAAAIVGLWPSFLLHSTQLIRDPLAMLCLLSLLLVLTLLLNRDLPGGKRCCWGGWRAARHVCSGWRAETCGTSSSSQSLSTLVLLLFRTVRQRKFMAGNAIVFC